MRNAILSVGAFILAIPAGVLPRRYWRSIDEHVPVTRAAALSGIGGILAAAAVGIPGYLRYAEAQGNLVAESLLQVTGWRPVPSSGPALSEPGAIATWFSGYIAPLTFAFLTPIGLLATYLAVTGYFRAVSAYVDDARGDPMLTALDALIRRIWRAIVSRREQQQREALEGPEVPDRLGTGRAAGCPTADLVVIASRRKTEWRRGLFIITDDKWYRLDTPFERQLPGGLRTFYPLKEIHDHEVLRRGVRYDLPPLIGAE